MLMPKRVKHRKQQRGSMKGRAYRGNKVTTATSVSWLWDPLDHIQSDRSSSCCDDKTY